MQRRTTLALVLLACGVPSAQDGGAAPAAPDFSVLEPKIAAFLSESALPGAGLYLARDGVVLYEAYFGTYDETTTVALASATKWLSGATLVALVDREKLRLDDPASRYVPELVDAKASITVRQLFNHTSGFPAEFLPGSGPFTTLEEAARKLAEAPLESEPGCAFKYGGVSMQVGGRVAEVAGGKSWRVLFDECIAGPLGLEHTKYGKLGLSENPSIAGGGVSSLREYARFLQMLVDGGKHGEVQVLSPEAVELLLTDHIGSATGLRATRPRLAEGSGYGVGCWVESKDAAGRTLVASSPGAFGFVPWIDREKNLVAVWMIEDRARESRGMRGDFADIRTTIDRLLDGKGAPEGRRGSGRRQR